MMLAHSNPDKSVSLHVQWQVIGSGESSLTNVTFERFVTSVFTEVAGQLIWSRKPPGAAFPCTYIRLLPCVCPSVGFQVRTLCVDFIAAFKVTPVDPPFLFSVYESITSCCHLKWLTVRSRGAGGAHHFKLIWCLLDALQWQQSRWADLYRLPWHHDVVLWKVQKETYMYKSLVRSTDVWSPLAHTIVIVSCRRFVYVDITLWYKLLFPYSTCHQK